MTFFLWKVRKAKNEIIVYNMSNDRIQYIDLAKGFCILLVVWGHSTGPLNSPEYLFKDTLSMFRMPLYFFLSGLFFKTYEGFGGFLKRKINKLLIPFLFWHLLFVVSVPFVSRTETFSLHLFWDYLLPGGDPHNTALWFLHCLFVLNIVFYLLVMVCGKISNDRMRTAIRCLTVIAVGCCGFVLSRYGIHLPIKLETVLTAMPFFAVGYVVGRNRSILTNNRYDRWLIPVAVLCFGITSLLATGETGYRFNEYSNLSIFQLYGGGITGIIFILLLSKKLVSLPLISYIGKYSIMLLVTHMPLIWHMSFFINKVGLHWFFTSVLSTLMVVLSYLLLIPMFKRFLPYVTAQKDIISVR